MTATISGEVAQENCPKMNWGAFDLNLLIVFDVVMQERCVTRNFSICGLLHQSIQTGPPRTVSRGPVRRDRLALAAAISSSPL